MIKNYSTAFEPQILCDVCSEAVSNPICPSCLSLEIDAWLTMYPNLRSQLLPRIAEFLRISESRIMVESNQCIKCNENQALVCPYCFTNFVLHQLKKLRSNKLILKEFLQFFNFDYEHTGYSKEAEKLGVI